MARLSEHSEQSALVAHLNRAGLCFAAVPNGGLRDKRTAQSLLREGVKAGVPDLLVFDPPPAAPGQVGTAIEMKRVGGRRPTDRQVEWLERLRARGWECFVAYGKQEALDRLRSLGYKV